MSNTKSSYQKVEAIYDKQGKPLSQIQMADVNLKGHTVYNKLGEPYPKGTLVTNFPDGLGVILPHPHIRFYPSRNQSIAGGNTISDFIIDLQETKKDEPLRRKIHDRQGKPCPPYSCIVVHPSGQESIVCRADQFPRSHGRHITHGMSRQLILAKIMYHYWILGGRSDYDGYEMKWTDDDLSQAYKYFMKVCMVPVGKGSRPLTKRREKPTTREETLQEDEFAYALEAILYPGVKWHKELAGSVPIVIGTVFRNIWRARIRGGLWFKEKGPNHRLVKEYVRHLMELETGTQRINLRLLEENTGFWVREIRCGRKTDDDIWTELIKVGYKGPCPEVYTYEIPSADIEAEGADGYKLETLTELTIDQRASRPIPIVNSVDSFEKIVDLYNIKDAARRIATVIMKSGMDFLQAGRYLEYTASERADLKSYMREQGEIYKYLIEEIWCGRKISK